MNIEQLRNQQTSLEQELETGKATFYRAEGALAIIKHQIAALEAEASKPVDEPVKAEPKKKG